MARFYWASSSYGFVWTNTHIELQYFLFCFSFTLFFFLAFNGCCWEGLRPSDFLASYLWNTRYMYVLENLYEGMTILSGCGFVCVYSYMIEAPTFDIRNQKPTTKLYILNVMYVFVYKHKHVYHHINHFDFNWNPKLYNKFHWLRNIEPTQPIQFAYTKF